MRVLVTGCSGFIGLHVVDRLLESVAVKQVIGVDMQAPAPGDSPEADRSSSRFTFHKLMLQEGGVLAGVGEFDVAVHLAALRSVQDSVANPRGSIMANVDSTLAVLELCRQRGRPVVIAGSSSVYGQRSAGEQRETDTAVPMSPYAASKLACETIAGAYWRTFEVSSMTLRYFNVYGPGQRPAGTNPPLIPSIMRAAKFDKTVRIYGNHQRDFTYVGDVAEATCIAAKLMAAGRSGSSVLNVGAGRPWSTHAVVALVSQVTGKTFQCEYYPRRTSEPEHTHANCHQTAHVLGSWSPRQLEDGLRITWDWFREFGEC